MEQVMAVRGLRAPRATSLRRSRRSIQSLAAETLEPRTLLSTTLQYVPVDARGGVGQPVTFQYDTATDGGKVIDAGVTVRSLFDTGFTAASSVNMFLRLDGVP